MTNPLTRILHEQATHPAHTVQSLIEQSLSLAEMQEFVELNDFESEYAP